MSQADYQLAPGQASSSPADDVAYGRLWPATSALWRREMVRFFRQRSRIASVLLTPVLLWIGLGAGLHNVFVTDGTTSDAPASGYMAYFFPGTLTMIVMFTAVFSSISVIEDRREGFMQGVLVAPVPRLAIVLGKVLGGTSIAVTQALLFMIFWPLIGPHPHVMTILLSAVTIVVTAVTMTTIGLCIAWPMDSTSAFHAIMMLLLMPMWFLSGALFPVSTAMPWLRVLMWINPLTYEQSALSYSLLGRDTVQTGLPIWLDATFMGLFALVMLIFAVRLVGKPRRDGT